MTKIKANFAYHSNFGKQNCRVIGGASAQPVSIVWPRNVLSKVALMQYAALKTVLVVDLSQ